MSLTPSSTCVVVADDGDRYLLARAFAQHRLECRLKFASDGLALLEALASSQPQPCLVILALHMPRLDGFETLKSSTGSPTTGPFPL